MTTIQIDLLSHTHEEILDTICEKAGVDVGDFLIAWASPPCRTFSPADYSNISRNHNFRNHDDPEKPPTTTNPEKARIAREHDELVQHILEFYEYLRRKGAECRNYLENPRGSLGKRPYMQPSELPAGFKKDTVDQCTFGRDYQKTTDIWNDDSQWSPIGITGDGRCHQRCEKGEFVGGYFKHFKALAMEPCRGPRGRGHTKEKNALPEMLLGEIS